MRGSIMLLVLALFLSEPGAALAQNPDVAAVAELSDAFFIHLSRTEIDEAYEVFLRGSSIDAAQVETLKQKTKSGLPLYGPSRGHELVRQEIFGTSVVRSVYVLKCQQHPITWEFYFYKPLDTWIVSSLTFMDTFELLVR